MSYEFKKANYRPIFQGRLKGIHQLHEIVRHPCPDVRTCPDNYEVGRRCRKRKDYLEIERLIEPQIDSAGD